MSKKPSARDDSSASISVCIKVRLPKELYEDFEIAAQDKEMSPEKMVIQLIRKAASESRISDIINGLGDPKGKRPPPQRTPLN